MLKTEMKLTWNGDKVIERGVNTVGMSAVKLGIIIQGNAVQLCPRDLSRLVKSIIIQTKKETITNSVGQPESGDYISKPSKDDEVLVGTNVDYSWYQEFGTAVMRAQPYLRPAFDLANGKALTVIKEAGKNELKEYLKQ